MFKSISRDFPLDIASTATLVKGYPQFNCHSSNLQGLFLKLTLKVGNHTFPEYDGSLFACENILLLSVSRVGGIQCLV